MRTIGKYEVVEKIGEGGFGSVYKGFDPHIRRHVAIKACTTEDDEIRLSRRTEWRDLGADTHVGMGQRMFATNVGETAILEARVVELKE